MAFRKYITLSYSEHAVVLCTEPDSIKNSVTLRVITHEGCFTNSRRKLKNKDKMMD